MNNFLKIDSKKEIDKILAFIAKILNEQKIKNVVIAVSGGIDSATSLALLSKVVSSKNISVLHLPYFDSDESEIEDLMTSLNLSVDRLLTISIEDLVEGIFDELEIPDEDLVRRGNIMARVRMVILYDFAKKNNALVCGTENKSEYHLGYFTRFGDEASDFEPIRHLYKTQVNALAKYLKILDSIIRKAPSANLWENQTDEEEFGFSYAEADSVLYLYFDKNESIEEIEKQGFKNARKIIDFTKKNSYKHKVPYSLE